MYSEYIQSRFKRFFLVCNNENTADVLMYYVNGLWRLMIIFKGQKKRTNDLIIYQYQYSSFSQLLHKIQSQSSI